jgi:hypothetical protein
MEEKQVKELQERKKEMQEYHQKLLNFRENMLKGEYPSACGQICYLKPKENKNSK